LKEGNLGEKTIVFHKHITLLSCSFQKPEDQRFSEKYTALILLEMYPPWMDKTKFKVCSSSYFITKAPLSLSVKWV
jgi:hypothetical protein